MNKWFGITKDGRKISFPHEELMDWAQKHGLEKDIEKENSYVTPEGTRIVRGKLDEMIQTAIKLGWDDLAEALFIYARL